MMGWSADATDKRELYKSANQSDKFVHTKPDESVRVKLSDSNQDLRARFISYDATVSVQDAVDKFMEQQHTKYPRCFLYIYAFDAQEHIPLRRIRYLREERYVDSTRPPSSGQISHKGRNYKKGTEPASEYAVRTMTTTRMTTPWLNMYNSHEGKSKLNKLIVMAMINYISRHALMSRQYIINKQDNTVWEYPKSPLPHPTYGEAEMKCIFYAHMSHLLLYPSHSHLITTTDWDAILTESIRPPRHIFIQTKASYLQDGKITYTKPSSSKGVKKIHEIYQPSTINTQCRYSYVFLMLCLKGQDYCKGGLVSYGFWVKEIHTLIKTYTPFITITTTDDVMTATFDTTSFFNDLRNLKHRKPRGDKSVKDFNNQMSDIWYTFLYFAGFDAGASRGGPTWEYTTNWTPGADSIEEALLLKSYPTITYTEQCPARSNGISVC